MDKPPSPKLPWLPEEISSRIVRQAGKGAVSRRHQEIAKTERYEDAGTKPFTKEEAQWVAGIYHGKICIFGSYGDIVGESFMLSPPQGFPAFRKTTLRHEYTNFDGKAFFTSIGTHTNREPYYETILDVTDILNNRLDTNIVKESNLVMDDMEDDAKPLTVNS